MKDIDRNIYLQCECGGHIMQVNCHIDFHGEDQYSQEWNFAMFKFGNETKPSFWNRVRTAWEYLKTGSMHKDQIVLQPTEADKLSTFIKDLNFGQCVPNNK